MLPLSAYISLKPNPKKHYRLWLPLGLFWFLLFPLFLVILIVFFWRDLMQLLEKDQGSFKCLKGLGYCIRNLSALKGFTIVCESFDTKFKYLIK